MLDLADFTAAPDRLTYTFKLRPGITWHDGQPFTAQDVKFTFEFLTDRRLTAPLLSKFALINGARDFKDGKAKEISGIQIIGTDQVKFALIARNALFLSNAATTIMLPMHLLKDVDPSAALKHPFSGRPATRDHSSSSHGTPLRTSPGQQTKSMLAAGLFWMGLSFGTLRTPPWPSRCFGPEK